MGCEVELVEKYSLAGDVRYKFKIKNKKIFINITDKDDERAYAKALEIAKRYSEC